MKHFVLISAALLTGFLTGFAQRIYFCNNYTASGDPIEAGSTWNINAGGGNVYILFQNGGRPINASTISFYIDYLNGSEYKAWDTKIVNVSSSNTWQVLDYKFTSANNYRVSVLINGTEIAKEYVTIKMNGSAASTGSTTTSSSTSSSSTLYYSGSSVTTGTDIDLNSGYVYGMNGPFSLNTQNTSKVYFKVSNGEKKLGTYKLIVDFYKMNSSGTYDFYVTKNYDISDLNWIYFSHDFYTAGSYKASVYNATSTWINNAFFTINSNTSGTASGSTITATGDYYSGSSVTAGTEIDLTSGYVYGLGGPFKRNGLINKKVNVSFKVNNGSKSINTYKLIVDVWKMKKSGTYEVYKTKYYDLKNSSLTWVVFTYEFEEAGSYKIMVYNASSAWINTVYITVD